MKGGILAFGSLIDDLGDELSAAIKGDPILASTPFPVEYGRFSLSRGGAPTLVPHLSGGKVTARILPLASACSDKFARDILYRREVRSKDQSREYQRRDGRNDILVETLLNFQGFDMVFYTDFNAEGKCFDLTAGKLASAAIESVGRADLGKDGITYLLNNIRNGIITPLTPEYEISVLSMTGAASLEEALEISKNG